MAVTLPLHLVLCSTILTRLINFTAITNKDAQGGFKLDDSFGDDVYAHDPHASADVLAPVLEVDQRKVLEIGNNDAPAQGSTGQCELRRDSRSCVPLCLSSYSITNSISIHKSMTLT